MFHHVGLSWMIATKEKYYFAADENDDESCTGRLWFNETNFQSLHVPLFDELFVTELQNRYNITCGLHAYDKRKYLSTGTTYFHGGQTLLKGSNKNPLISLCVAIKFLENLINKLEKKIVWRCLTYQNKTNEIFQNIPTGLKTQLLNTSMENIEIC